MTYMYNELKGKEKLNWALSELRHEQHKGVHTFHMCDCERKGCRSNKCILCWEEEITKLKQSSESKESEK